MPYPPRAPAARPRRDTRERAVAASAVGIAATRSSASDVADERPVRDRRRARPGGVASVRSIGRDAVEPGDVPQERARTPAPTPRRAGRRRCGRPPRFDEAFAQVQQVALGLHLARAPQVVVAIDAPGRTGSRRDASVVRADDLAELEREGVERSPELVRGEEERRGEAAARATARRAARTPARSPVPSGCRRARGSVSGVVRRRRRVAVRRRPRSAGAWRRRRRSRPANRPMLPR